MKACRAQSRYFPCHCGGGPIRADAAKHNDVASCDDYYCHCEAVYDGRGNLLAVGDINDLIAFGNEEIAEPVAS